MFVLEAEETEKLDERDEDAEVRAVPVESESYVNLKKTMANKHNQKLDNVLQENKKLCREFLKKQVKSTFYMYFNLILSNADTLL